MAGLQASGNESNNTFLNKEVSAACGGSHSSKARLLFLFCDILICMQKHSQHNKDKRTRFLRKIYLSLYSKGLRKGYVWEVSWRLNNTEIYWPPALLAIAALLSRSPGLLNRGPWAGSHASILSPKTLTPTNWTSCRTWLYHCFLWASHLHPTQPVYSQGYPLIYSTGCACYLHRCIFFLTAQLGRR